ncbi:hypothetical protein PTHTG4_09790 [Parageobacillus thermoglucosidasius]|uniref:hypothetical protein n=1 Tax=Parageobacillus thermoglucosidasius TaxID=1426 RepID=UPI000F62011F|nr:hypothetical protein [Parageobacillus thermoglucosidasius]GCD81917.1 hypothetical protein PTHTG4_09790 [Parageobacillus thermoglucosidasius]
MNTKSDSFYEQLQSLYYEITSFYDELNKYQSHYDKQVSAIYHELEKVELTHANAYEYALKLQDVLRKRRVVKDELARLQPVYNYINETFNKLQKQIERAISSSNKIRKSLNMTLSISEVLKN